MEHMLITTVSIGWEGPCRRVPVGNRKSKAVTELAIRVAACSAWWLAFVYLCILLFFDLLLEVGNWAIIKLQD